MVIKYKSSDNHASQRGDDIHLAQLQSCSSHSASQCRQIVFVGIADFLNQAMFSQSLEQSGHLMALFALDGFTQAAIAESADIEFAADNRTEQLKIIIVKKIKPSITAVVLFDGSGYFVQVFDPAGRVVNRRDKLKISAIGRLHQFDKHRQAVNGFSQRRRFHFPCAVPVFHPSVVLKKRNIIGDRLNAKNQTELVIHLDGNRSHPMFDTGPLTPRVEGITHFILIAAVEFTTEERGDILGFDRVNGGTDNFVIDQFKIAFLPEEDVRGVLDLHKAPVVVIDKMPKDRAIASDKMIQLAMKSFNIDIIGKLLSPIQIVNLDKDIVEHLETDLLFAKLCGQKVMPVAVELQPEWCPGGDSQITQPPFGGDKVEVIMQALPRYCFERCFAGLFIMPGLISRTGLHRRKDVYQSGMCSSLTDNFVDPVFFSEVLFADKFDFKTVIAGDFFSIGTDFFPQWISPLCKIEYANAFCSEKRTHSLSVADAGYCSGKYDSVKAGEDAFDFSIVPLDKVLHRTNSPYGYFQRQGFSEKCRVA